MQIYEFYKYSWFANFAYFEWNHNQTVTFNTAEFKPSFLYDGTRP